MCAFHSGDVPCVDFGSYQERHVVYAGYDDTRSCSACTCGPPAGGRCSTELSIYADDACASVPSYAVTIDSSQPYCYDLVAGAALGSKSATPPTYSPGACQPSGGEPMGAATPVGASTFCCIPGSGPSGAP